MMPATPSLTAVIVHAALILGLVMFGAVAHLVESALTRNTRVLLVSVVELLLFATFRPSRLAQP